MPGAQKGRGSAPLFCHTAATVFLRQECAVAAVCFSTIHNSRLITQDQFAGFLTIFQKKWKNEEPARW
jgi:hypothetical protein